MDGVGVDVGVLVGVGEFVLVGVCAGVLVGVWVGVLVGVLVGVGVGGMESVNGALNIPLFMMNLPLFTLMAIKKGSYTFILAIQLVVLVKLVLLLVFIVKPFTVKFSVVHALASPPVITTE